MNARDLMGDGEEDPPTFRYLLRNFKSKQSKSQMEKIMTHFGQESSEEDMFAYLWETEDFHCYMSPPIGDGSKKLIRALRAREAASQSFNEGELEKALENYNLSIILAPHPRVTSLPDETSAHGEPRSYDRSKNDGKGEPENVQAVIAGSSSHSEVKDDSTSSIGDSIVQPEGIDKKSSSNGKDIDDEQASKITNGASVRRKEKIDHDTSVRPKEKADHGANGVTHQQSKEWLLPLEEPNVESQSFEIPEITQRLIKVCKSVGTEAAGFIDDDVVEELIEDLQQLLVPDVKGEGYVESRAEKTGKDRWSKAITQTGGIEKTSYEEEEREFEKIESVEIVKEPSPGEELSPNIGAAKKYSEDRDQGGDGGADQGGDGGADQGGDGGVDQDAGGDGGGDKGEDGDESGEGSGNELVPSDGQTMRCDDTYYSVYQHLIAAFELRAMFLFKLKEFERSLMDSTFGLKYGAAGGCLHELNSIKNQCLEEIEKGGKRKCKERGTMFSYGISSPPIVEETNPVLPALSAAVKLRSASPEGRFLVATRNIRPGEVLGVEQPYCATVNRGEFMKFCAKCLQRCVNPIPCPDCSVVVFCSEECTMLDDKHPHWPLCNVVLPSLVALKMDSVVLLTANVLTQTSYLKLKEFVLKRQSSEVLAESVKGYLKGSIYESFDYETVYGLSTNVKNWPEEERFLIGTQAFVLTKLLKDSKRYFLDEDGLPFMPTYEDVMLTGSTVLHHLMNLKSSAISLSEMRVLTNDLEKSWSPSIGCGVYPTTALFNHSCNPNASIHNHGKTVALISTRTIAKNTPVSVSYVKKFRLSPGDLRKSVLKENYYFDCTCEACLNDWFPEFDEIFQLKCTKCSKTIDMKRAFCNTCQIHYREGKEYKGLPPYNFFFVKDKLYQAAAMCKKTKLKILSKGECSQRDRDVIINAIELMEKYVKDPCTMLLDAQDALRISYERESTWALAKERTKGWIMGPAFLINSSWLCREEIYDEEAVPSPKKSPSKRKGRNRNEATSDLPPIPPPFVSTAIRVEMRVDTSHHERD